MGLDQFIKGGNVWGYTAPDPASVPYLQNGVPGILVAASTSSTAVKSSADYICTGTNDDVVINLALAAAGIAGVVTLANGIFNIGAPIILSAIGQRLQGMNQWHGVASGASAGYVNGIFLQNNSNCDMIQITARKCQVRDIFLQGNQANQTSTSITQNFTDGVTNGTTTFTCGSAITSGNFTKADIGKTITGTNIPAGTTITAVSNINSVTLSQAATGSGTNLSYSVVGRTVNCCGISAQVADQAMDTHLENIYIFNVAGHGLDIQAGHTTARKVYCETSSQYGVHVWGIANDVCCDSVVVAASNVLDGFYDESGGQLADTHFVNAPGCNSYINCEVTYLGTQNAAAFTFVYGMGKAIIGGRVIEPGHEAVRILGGTGHIVIGLSIYGAGQTTTNTYDGIALQQAPDNSWPTNYVIADNNFLGHTSSRKLRYAINEVSGAGPGVIQSNVIASTCFTTGAINATHASTRTTDNIGFVNEATGAATIANTTTSIVVTHGLAITPNINKILLTRQNNPTNAVSSIWVSNITSTQFTINSNADPGASGLTVGWAVVA